MNNNTINLAIQVLPQSNKQHPYSIVDKAIEVIQKSGLPYKVCPFETVVEGKWDELMAMVKEIHEVCYANNTQSMMCYLKIQTRNSEDVTINDKMEKYQ
ncbi:MAG: MTH1187 family thiamine-binding protein [Prolixibacteraceae bacterium]|nr:MTH1187 family thiamine-binding protein [Prolixibacteraceae bacterium]